jgi:hypothetical protein
MNRCRLLLIAILSLGAIATMPATSQAQCVEKCVLVRDGDTGQYIGHGCIAGTAGRNCVATVWDCTIQSAGCGGDEMLLDNLVLDEDGRQAATAVVCTNAKQVVELAVYAPSERTRAVTFRNPLPAYSNSRVDFASRF